jgi:superfamily II DNA or RNA helicase
MTKNIKSTRDERQELSLQRWIDNKCIGTIQACTGYGKTVVSAKCIKYIKAKRDNLTITVVVPKINLVEQITNEYIRFGVDMTNVQVYVINTYIRRLMNKEIDNKTDLLVLDEVHRYGGEEELKESYSFSNLWNLVEYKSILCLTATVQRLDSLHEIIVKHSPIVDTVTIEDASTNGWVTNYYQFNLGLELTAFEQQEYDRCYEYFKGYFKKFQYNFLEMMKCKSAVYCLAKANNDKELAKTYNSASFMCSKYMQEYKRILFTSQSKVDAIKEITSFTDIRFIIFGESIEFVENLAASLKDVTVYHSKLKTKEKRERLNDFKVSKTLKGIISASALDEGFDDENLQLGICSSYNSNPTKNIQRIGRIVRLTKSNPNKKAFFVNLYIKNSKDQDWLEKNQVNSKAIEIDTIQELTNIINNLK